MMIMMMMMMMMMMNKDSEKLCFRIPCVVKSVHYNNNVNLFQIKAKAVITDVVSLSSTVKSLTLKIDDKRVTFKAGQW